MNAKNAEAESLWKAEQSWKIQICLFSFGIKLCFWWALPPLRKVSVPLRKVSWLWAKPTHHNYYISKIHLLLFIIVQSCKLCEAGVVSCHEDNNFWKQFTTALSSYNWISLLCRVTKIIISESNSQQDNRKPLLKNCCVVSRR